MLAALFPPPVLRGRVRGVREGVFDGAFTVQTPSPALHRSTGGGRKTGHDLSDSQ
jgi:hypothetical protein